jgi:hypothetical protein
MQTLGNKRAAEMWEYHLPSEFRRPVDNDAQMESFIRAKYEYGKVSLCTSKFLCLDTNVLLEFLPSTSESQPIPPLMLSQCKHLHHPFSWYNLRMRYQACDQWADALLGRDIPA